LSSKVHFISLKLIKDLESSSIINSKDSFKLLNFKHIELVNRNLEDLKSIIENKTNENHQCFHSVKSLNIIKEECLDKLAQLLEVSWQNELISCKKQEIKELFSNFYQQYINENEKCNLLSMVLNNC
jgi:hypothetical protein